MEIEEGRNSVRHERIARHRAECGGKAPGARRNP
jgi:hypothetical protein